MGLRIAETLIYGVHHHQFFVSLFFVFFDECAFYAVDCNEYLYFELTVFLVDSEFRWKFAGFFAKWSRGGNLAGGKTRRVFSWW